MPLNLIHFPSLSISISMLHTNTDQIILYFKDFQHDTVYCAAQCTQCTPFAYRMPWEYIPNVIILHMMPFSDRRKAKKAKRQPKQQQQPNIYIIFTMENAKMCGFLICVNGKLDSKMHIACNRWIMVHGDADTIATNENTSGSMCNVYIKKKVIE